MELTGEMKPAIPSRAYYNKEKDTIECYYTNASQIIEFTEDEVQLLPTAEVLQTTDVLRKWLRMGEEQNILLVGPHGCAKS